ncbi:cation:proton antiporter [Actinotalea sp. M2MS4P-6]|uniref:cation:proton antiporter domain-containing protein n=1 Tax=Actinotalea sp. M2MS4P-6 TaxID=2983762 RepID=UPI0021E4009C|nr:cation:proton antiporter [Actinotalea sp. M2MS4P-6]MCV2394265.1 cation:proton antiporter [Actinotalea sp. M2MS4P-6]
MGVLAAVFATLVVAITLASRRLARLYLTTPIAFVGAGLLTGVVVDAGTAGEPTRVVAESALALVLFHDAAQVRPKEIGRERGLELRLLLVGLPLTIGVGYLVVRGLLPELSWPMALLLASALAPTDAGLGAATVLNPVVPVRVRRLLNVESGLNDGLATPVVLFAIAASLDLEHAINDQHLVLDALTEIAIALLVGAAVGLVGGRAVQGSAAHGWSTGAARATAALALPIVAYAGSGVLHGNGFIAAFVAGTAFASATPRLGDDEDLLALTESAADLLTFAVWFSFGLVLATATESLDWRSVLFAVLSLTVIRMVPVALSLLGAGFRPPTVAFIGWFGPRGLASLVFALIALTELDADDQRATVVGVIALTVLMSVVLHGTTADPWAQRYGAWTTRVQPAGEIREAAAPRTRSRMTRQR